MFGLILQHRPSTLWGEGKRVRLVDVVEPIVWNSKAPSFTMRRRIRARPNGLQSGGDEAEEII